jgi:hypothetical protein
MVARLRNCENVKVAHFDVSGIAETWKCPSVTSTSHDHEHGFLSWPISERRRRAFFLFLLAIFLRVAARERTGAAEGLDDEQKQNDFS